MRNDSIYMKVVAYCLLAAVLGGVLWIWVPAWIGSKIVFTALLIGGLSAFIEWGDRQGGKDA